MIGKNEFKNILLDRGSSIDQIEEILKNFDDLIPIASKVNSSVPSIGFLSSNKRLKAFYSVCENLDKLIEDEEINMEDSQLILMILLVKNKTFEKAAGEFQMLGMGQRFSTIAKAEMPRSAREWLAGIEMFGR